MATAVGAAAQLQLPVLPDVDLDYQASAGRIDRLEVENFKSYRGHQHIGPFKAFTAVIGPNGSGKSNLMDAISFVLGVKTTQLRGSLKELLYSAGSGDAGAQEDRPRRGYVKLVYVVPPGEDAEDAEEAEVHFTRAIQPSGPDPDATYQSVYKVNDKTVSWEAYAKRLGSYGILVKVRNFLVFQVRRVPNGGAWGGWVVGWRGGGSERGVRSRGWLIWGGRRPGG